MAESEGIDWKLRLVEAIKESSEMQTDTTFKIEEDNKEEYVKAHRLVLGMASEVFRKMLFVTGTNDREAKEILVKETTVAAFRAMVDAIYNTKTIRESLVDKTVREMFAVVNLVKKYEIPELVLTARDCLATFPLREEVVLEVAAEAIKYLDIFDEVAKDLMLHCAKFLMPKLSDTKSIFKFTTANKEHAETMVQLFALMDKMPEPEQCDNCSQNPCRDGQEVEKREFRVGLRVACSYSSGLWGALYKGSQGTVDSISVREGYHHVTLKDCQTGSGQGHLDSGLDYPVLMDPRDMGPQDDGLTFRFCCETA